MPQRTAYCVVSAFSVCLRNSRRTVILSEDYYVFKSVCTKTILIVADDYNSILSASGS